MLVYLSLIKAGAPPIWHTGIGFCVELLVVDFYNLYLGELTNERIIRKYSRRVVA